MQVAANLLPAPGGLVPENGEGKTEKPTRASGGLHVLREATLWGLGRLPGHVDSKGWGAEGVPAANNAGCREVWT